MTSFWNSSLNALLCFLEKDLNLYAYFTVLIIIIIAIVAFDLSQKCNGKTRDLIQIIIFSMVIFAFGLSVILLIFGLHYDSISAIMLLIIFSTSLIFLIWNTILKVIDFDLTHVDYKGYIDSRGLRKALLRMKLINKWAHRKFNYYIEQYNIQSYIILTVITLLSLTGALSIPYLILSNIDITKDFSIWKIYGMLFVLISSYYFLIFKYIIAPYLKDLSKRAIKRIVLVLDMGNIFITGIFLLLNEDSIESTVDEFMYLLLILPFLVIYHYNADKISS